MRHQHGVVGQGRGCDEQVVASDRRALGPEIGADTTGDLCAAVVKGQTLERAPKALKGLEIRLYTLAVPRAIDEFRRYNAG